MEHLSEEVDTNCTLICLTKTFRISLPPALSVKLPTGEWRSAEAMSLPPGIREAVRASAGCGDGEPSVHGIPGDSAEHSTTSTTSDDTPATDLPPSVKEEGELSDASTLPLDSQEERQLVPVEAPKVSRDPRRSLKSRLGRRVSIQTSEYDGYNKYSYKALAHMLNNMWAMQREEQDNYRGKIVSFIY